MKTWNRFFAALLAALMALSLVPVSALAAGDGWQEIDGTWRYYDENGDLARNEWRDGCWLGADGSWKYRPRGSWHRDGRGWWYGDTSGWYAAGQWLKIDGSWYYFKANGYMAQDEWVGGYLLDASGVWDDGIAGAWEKNAMGWLYGDYARELYVTGWARIDGVWYCFDEAGYMYANEWHDGYYLGGGGAWTYQPRGGWEYDGRGYSYADTSGWYARSSWQRIDGSWYYFDSNAYMVSDTVMNGYCFNADGAWNGLRIGDGWATIAFRDATVTVNGIDLNLAREHAYYANETWEQAMQGDAFAKYYADAILSDDSLATDLERVQAAAAVVSNWCWGMCEYGNDDARHYRSPYGVFVAGVYTCAGSTRALGRILDYMGFSWIHCNENDYTHQWCELYMDGQWGMADGMAGIAAYGDAEEAYAANGIFHW